MDRLDAYIDSHREEYVGRLQALCRIPSVSARNQSIDEAAAAVQDLLRRTGAAVSVRQAEGGPPLVVGEIKGASERTLLFYNHYDVVPEAPIEDWTSPPFEAAIRDGCLIARGACDDKGDLVARLCAVEALLQTYGELPATVKFVLDGEEEIGSPHLQGVVEANRELLRADACVGEGGHQDELGRPMISLGSRGRMAFVMESQGATRSFHSSLTAIVPNPAWDIIWAFASMKGPDERVCIEGFYDKAHQPDETELAHIARIHFDEARTRGSLGISRFTGNVSGVEIQRRLLYEPTLEAAEMLAGPKFDGLQGMPRRAVGTVRFGLVPYQDPLDMHDLLRRHLDRHGFEHVTLTPMSHRHPGKTPVDHPFVDVVSRAIAGFYGQDPVVLPQSPGIGTPIHELAEPLGVPLINAGLAAIESMAHAPDERIRLDDFHEGIKFITRLIFEFAESR